VPARGSQQRLSAAARTSTIWRFSPVSAACSCSRTAHKLCDRSTPDAQWAAAGTSTGALATALVGETLYCQFSAQWGGLAAKLKSDARLCWPLDALHNHYHTCSRFRPRKLLWYATPARAPQRLAGIDDRGDENSSCAPATYMNTCWHGHRSPATGAA